MAMEDGVVGMAMQGAEVDTIPLDGGEVGVMKVSSIVVLDL